MTKDNTFTSKTTVGEDSITFKKTSRKHGTTTTEFFDFLLKQCTTTHLDVIIARSEITVSSFDDMDQDIVKKASDEFVALGGKNLTKANNKKEESKPPEKEISMATKRPIKIKKHFLFKNKD